MVQPCRDLDLGEKPFGAEHRPEFRAQDFEGDVTIELAVVSEVDDGHPSRSKLALNRVTLAEDRGDGGLGGLGHGFAPAAEDEHERVASGRDRDNKIPSPYEAG
jgi:hypothetical protein